MTSLFESDVSCNLDRRLLTALKTFENAIGSESVDDQLHEQHIPQSYCNDSSEESARSNLSIGDEIGDSKSNNPFRNDFWANSLKRQFSNDPIDRSNDSKNRFSLNVPLSRSSNLAESRSIEHEFSAVIENYLLQNNDKESELNWELQHLVCLIEATTYKYAQQSNDQRKDSNVAIICTYFFSYL